MLKYGEKMKIKAILFDLDGTLLPMDQDIFIGDYMRRLGARMQSLGYDGKEFVKNIMKGTYVMIGNNGSQTNEKAFWEFFESIYGDKIYEEQGHLEAFYAQEFDKISAVCGNTPKARATIDKVKSMGLRVVLATNPIFPAVATRARIGWAGLCPEDFELITTYENISFSKPNPEYYIEITRRLGVAPEECLMVGNDVSDDMVAQSLGMEVFLLTDNLINKDGADISKYPNGDFDCLNAYIDSIQ